MFRNNSKTRQERKHQTDDINNTLGILPLDYLQRAEVGDPGIDDTHLIGFQAFISANRSLLLPKSLPVYVNLLFIQHTNVKIILNKNIFIFFKMIKLYSLIQNGNFQDHV